MKSGACFLAGLLATTLVQAEVINIGNQELAALQAQGVPVIDIRTQSEWQRTGRLQGSHAVTFYPGEKLEESIFLSNLRGIADAQQPVILVCQSGKRTQALAERLIAEAGYKEVYQLDRGLLGWMRAGYELQASR